MVDNICVHFQKKLFPKKDKLTTTDYNKLKQYIAILFTIYDLYKKYNTTFKGRLKEECEKYGTSVDAFLAFREHYAELLNVFEQIVYKGEYDNIQNNKKLHFWMNSGTIKISTINSFKGWESEVVFLVLENKFEGATYFNANFAELLYTGLTRCRRNLVIINYGNEEYDKKIQPLIKKIQ